MRQVQRDVRASHQTPSRATGYGLTITECSRSELDEMWSYVRRKSNARWLWHAIDQHTGKVLAYVFGRRQDAVFLQLKALLKPLGITRYYTDGWGAYERHVEPEQHTVGKENTQKIEVRPVGRKEASASG